MSSVIPAADLDANEVLRIAASLDQGSEHPLAHAIVAEARRQSLQLTTPDAFESASGKGASVMYMSIGNKLAGLLAVADPIKPSTFAVIAELKSKGLRLVMATGDGVTTAKAVGEELGIDEVHGEVRPQGKNDLVARLQPEGFGCAG